MARFFLPDDSLRNHQEPKVVCNNSFRRNFNVESKPLDPLFFPCEVCGKDAAIENLKLWDALF